MIRFLDIKLLYDFNLLIKGKEVISNTRLNQILCSVGGKRTIWSEIYVK